MASGVAGFSVGLALAGAVTDRVWRSWEMVVLTLRIVAGVLRDGRT